jgi:uncharacterized protein (DUF2147 family)
MKSLSMIGAALAASWFATAAQAAPDPICGRWLTEDKQGVIHVYLETDGRLAGRIVGGSGPRDKDDKNPDAALRSQPLIGLKVLYGFARDGTGWKDGEIYDPDEGKVYKATARLSQKDASRLLLRGYVGSPLFGSTEEWTRESPAADSACRDPQLK